MLKHVTSRWGVLILVALRQGTHRFSDLRRKMGGVSEKMLAQSLQALEHDGFVDRVSYPVVPPHVEYSLTPMGQEVSEKVAALALTRPTGSRIAGRPGKAKPPPGTIIATCSNPPDKSRTQYHPSRPFASDTAPYP